MVRRALIFSDGKKGHLNQSIAFCKYMDLTYDIVEIRFKNRFFKLLSYMFDFLSIYTMSIFEIRDGLPRLFQSLAVTESVIANEGRNPEKMRDGLPHSVRSDGHCEMKSPNKRQLLVVYGFETEGDVSKETTEGWTKQSISQSSLKNKKYNLVVCAGSSTYYAAKVIAKKLKIKSVAMMLPRGYKYDYDVIFAQTHDNPPKASNIIEIPANFSFIEPIGLFKPKKQSIGIIIGGNNNYLEMNKDKLKEQLDFIKERFKDFEIAITSSPRTPKEIEEFIKSYHFDYEVIYSLDPINPIPDFLEHCDTVFITSDSTSMISESISYGEANVVILPLVSKKENKFNSFISKLENDGYLHIFNGIIINKNKKINFKEFIKG